MSTRMKILIGLLGMLVIVILIGAGSPITMADAIQRVRPGVGRHASVSILDANTTTAYFLTNSGGSIPACYPDRGTLVVGALAAATCCVGQAGTGLTIGDQTTAAGVVVTDANGPDGNSDCRQLAAGAEWHMTLDVRSHRSNYGSRTGVCTAPVLPSNAVTGFAPRPACRVDTDCTTVGGAPSGTTCNTAAVDSDFVPTCLYVFCKATAASTKVWAHFEH